MRHATLALFALAVIAAPLAAQSGEGTQPSIVLTIFAGAGTGHGLWTIAKQPLQVLGTSQYDTLRLSQSVTPTIIAGFAATYFPSAHLGLHAELSYVGLPVDGSCTGLFYNADFENKNQQTCDDIQRSGSDGGSVAMFVGATFRAASRGAISPYARLNVGIINETRSTIEMSGSFVAAGAVGVREVLTDPNSRHAQPMVGAALGFTRPISPGYQFRWEASDLVVSMNRAMGPGVPTAGAGAIPPVGSRLYHHFSLKLGLAVVLEKKRGRRY